MKVAEKYRARAAWTRASLATLAIASVSAGEATAQPSRSDGAAAGAGLEEIVVTARKREESLQTTPISITALAGDALTERSVDDLRDVAQFTPNLVITPSAEIGGAGAQVFIRGIGQFEQIMTTDPGVGIYIDGVYLGRTPGAMLEMLDFERIEVLRGPQGTLFGKNTIGGAVNATSRRPGNELEGKLGVTVGNYGRLETSLAFNTPLVGDSAAMRVNFLSRKHDGYGDVIDFATGNVVGEAGAEDVLAGRFALRVDLAPNFTTLLTVDGTRARDGQSAHHLEAVDPTHPFVGIHNLFNPGDPFDGRFLLGDRYDTYADGDFEADIDVWGTALIAEWDLGPALVKSVSSYRTMKVSTAVDGDGSPAVIVQNYDDTDQEQWSQEFQAIGTSFNERLKWVGGVLYFHEEARAHNVNFLLADVPLFADGSADNRSAIKTDNWAVYGEATVALTDRFSATAGLRYTFEKKRFTFDFRRAVSGVSTFPPGAREDEWKAFTPRFGLEYRLTDDILSYVSAARGFRSGGFNGRANTSTGLQSFDPEYVWTYEFGLKTEFFDNRLRINGAAFYNDYSDLQFLIIRADPVEGFALFTENAGAARIKGFELEMAAVPVEGLEFNLGIGYLDSEITKISPDVGIAPGVRLQEAPEWTVNFGAQYEADIRDFGKLRGRLDVVYQGRTFHDGENSPIIGEKAFTLLNARLTYVHPTEKWDASLYGRNLTDERYRVAGINVYNDIGLADTQYGAPREFGVSLNYHF